MQSRPARVCMLPAGELRSNVIGAAQCQLFSQPVMGHAFSLLCVTLNAVCLLLLTLLVNMPAEVLACCALQAVVEAALGSCMLLSSAGHLWSVNNVAATFQAAPSDVHKPQVRLKLAALS